MTFLRGTVMPLLLLMLASCVSIYSTLETDVGYCRTNELPRVYCGTIITGATLLGRYDPGSECPPITWLFCLLDFPFELVADTVVLPYTVYAQVRYGNHKASCLDEHKGLSSEAKEVLFYLRSAEFRDEVLGRGKLIFWCNRWQVAVTAKENNRRLEVPLQTDGDAADLYRRVRGQEHPTLKGELSEDYKAFLEGKGR